MKNKNELVERKAFVDTVGIKIKCADFKNEFFSGFVTQVFSRCLISPCSSHFDNHL